MANDFDESSANEEASKGLSWWYSADVLSRDKSDKTAKRIRRISITDRLLRHPGRLSMVYFGIPYCPPVFTDISHHKIITSSYLPHSIIIFSHLSYPSCELFRHNV